MSLILVISQFKPETVDRVLVEPNGDGGIVWVSMFKGLAYGVLMLESVEFGFGVEFTLGLTTVEL